MKKITTHKIYGAGQVFKSNLESINGQVVKSDLYGNNYRVTNDKSIDGKRWVDPPKYSNFHKPVLANEIFSMSLKK